MADALVQKEVTLHAAEPVAADRPRPILRFRDVEFSEGRGG
jgi:hypothetical protein